MAGSQRETRVVLTAQVANYLSGMEQAQRATRGTADEASRAEAQLQKQHGAMSTLGAGLTAFGAAAIVGVGLAVAKFMEFDAQMSSVQAATHETADNMSLLRDAAIEAGAVTAFSATEAARAIEELSKAGVSTTEILGGGLTGAMSLAAAGALDVGQAAEIAATAMTQFKLGGEEVPHIADLLAAGAGKAQGSVEDLSMALNQGGLVASQAGFSIEETTGVLAAFAGAGLLGSDAGTSLKTALLMLQNPSVKAANVMKDYGIEVYNADGTMKSFTEIAGVLETSLGGLTEEQRNSALATVFGSDAVRAASVLYSEGASGIGEWTRKVNDAGYAAETAAIMQDNLAGDLEKLGGSFDTLLIKTGAASDGPLRFLVQSVTEMVDAFSNAPAAVQGAALGLTALTGGLALTAGAALLVIPKVYELKIALDVLATSSIPGVAAGAAGMTSAVTRSGAALAATAKFLTGPWGVALAAATVGVVLLSKFLDSLKSSGEEVTNSLVTAKNAAEIFQVAAQGRDITAFADVKAQLQDLPGLLAQASEQTGNVFSRFTGSEYFGAIQALQDVGTQLGALVSEDLPSAQAAFGKLAAETDGSKEQLQQLVDALGSEYTDALTQVATAQGLQATNENLLQIAMGTTEEQATNTAQAYLAQVDAGTEIVDMINELLNSFNELNGVNQDAVSSNAAYQASLAGISEDVARQKEEFIALQKEGYEAAHGSLDGFVESLNGFSLSLDENTAAGSANASSLAQVASDAQSAALAQYQVDQSTMSAKAAADKYAGTLADQRAKFEQSAVAAGYNADQVRALADRVFQLPTSKQVNVLAQTSQAQAALDSFITRNDGRVISVRQQLITEAISAGAAPGAAKAAYRADGGVVDYYADGGVRESHVAQIAPAGDWRVWAEPETGGEAYIPLAPSKRGQSLRIWEETGRRLQAFADGGMYDADRYMSGGLLAGMSGPSVTVLPQAGPTEVSLSGARLTLEVGGRQIEAVIQDQIVSADRDRRVALGNGRKT